MNTHVESPAPRVPAPGAPGTSSIRRALVSGALRLFGLAGIEVVLPDGTRVPASRSPVIVLRMRNWRPAKALLLRDQMAMFKSYVEEDFDLEPVSGDLAESLLAAVGIVLAQSRDYHWVTAARHSSRFRWQQNTRTRHANLSVHYSAPPAFWLSFLRNEYPIYSHYLFAEGETYRDWEVACERKLAFAVDACRMQPGDRVLNIGEGWAGWLTYAGRRGMRVTGLTLNDESYEACLAKIAAEGLGETCEVVHTDFYNYRASAPFDAITNMGVTEHLTDYDRLIARYAVLLKPGGCVYSDFVGSYYDGHFRSVVQKYIYPGAAPVYLPKLLDAVERNGNFDVVATYDDRESYEKTCMAWARTAEDVRDTIVRDFGERQYRWLWMYLWFCVYGFRTDSIGLTGTRVVLRRRGASDRL